MSKKIIGVTVGTQLPKPNFKQTDPTKGDYIRNKPDFDGLKSRVRDVEERMNSINIEVDTTLTLSGFAADAKTVGDLWRLVADDNDVIALLVALGVYHEQGNGIGIDTLTLDNTLLG